MVLFFSRYLIMEQNDSISSWDLSTQPLQPISARHFISCSCLRTKSVISITAFLCIRMCKPVHGGSGVCLQHGLFLGRGANLGLGAGVARLCKALVQTQQCYWQEALGNVQVWEPGCPSLLLASSICLPITSSYSFLFTAWRSWASSQ